jgi:hypothetical protein
LNALLVLIVFLTESPQELRVHAELDDLGEDKVFDIVGKTIKIVGKLIRSLSDSD